MKKGKILKRRVLAWMLAIAMVVTLTPTSAFADESATTITLTTSGYTISSPGTYNIEGVTISTSMSKIPLTINTTGEVNLNILGNISIKLSSDPKSPLIKVTAGCNLAISGNNYAISTTGTGNVIRIDNQNATVTINDSSMQSNSNASLYNKGKLTLKNVNIQSLGNHGVQNESSSGIFNMEGGSISNCKNYGVYNNGGTFNMKGATISECQGDGVYNYNGTFNMEGGKIEKSASYGVHNRKGTFKMIDGAISGCTNSGVFNEESGTFEMQKGTIEGNGTKGSQNGSGVCTTATTNIYGGNIINNEGLNGGGIYATGTLNLEQKSEYGNAINITGNKVTAVGGGIAAKYVSMSGTIIIKDNYSEEICDNLAVVCENPISIKGSLANSDISFTVTFGISTGAEETFGRVTNGYRNQNANATLDQHFHFETKTKKFSQCWGDTSSANDTEQEIWVNWAKHSHEWNYSFGTDNDENKVYAWCSNDVPEPCEYYSDEQEKASLNLTVTADDMTYSGSTYNKASVTTNGISEITGATIGDITYYLSDGSTQTNSENSGAETNGAAPKNAGSYEAKVVVTKGSNTYTAVKKFTIKKKPLTNSMVSLSFTEKPYMDGTSIEPPTVTVADGSNLKTTDYTVSGTGMTAQTNIGEYSVTVTSTENGNYSGTVTTSWKIKGKEFLSTEITATSYNAPYDGNAHSISVQKPEGATVTYSTEATGQYSEICPTFTDVTEGAKTIYFKIDKEGYSTCEKSATVTITPKPLTATVSAENKVYDGNATAIVKTTVDSGVTGETINITGVSGNFANKNVGTGKTVTVNALGKNITVTGGRAKTSNYTITIPSTAGTATITAKEVTITATATNRTYNGTNDVAVSGTVTESNGLVKGDNVTVPDVIGIMADANVGENKAVNISSMTLAGTDAVNYSLKGQPTATVDITAKEITVKAKDASKTYKEADPKLTYELDQDTPLVENDTLTDITVIRADGENAGTYAMTASQTVGANPNYAITFQQGTFTIQKKTVTVKPVDSGKHKGQTDPELPYTVEGLVEGDLLQGILLQRTHGETDELYYEEKAGTYTISVTLPDESENPNYEITAETGTFTIEDHTFAEEWTDDEENHWHVCTACEDCTTVSDKAEHDYGAWKVTKEATETETGVKVKTCKVCGHKKRATIPVVPHTHAFGEWQKNETSHWKECTCGELSEKAEHAYGEWVQIVAPSGDSAGIQERTCSVCGYKESEPIPKPDHTHSYGAPSFTWADDCSSAKAVFTCESDATHVETVDCTVTSEETKPTCTVDGKVIYTAKVTFDGKEYTDTKETEQKAAGHKYGAPVFTWAEDNSSATAAFTCEADATHTETVEATVTKEETKPTCTEAGKTVYTAKAVLDGEEYTDTKETEIPAVGHKFGAPKFVWGAGLSTATATFICESDSSHTEDVDCTITSEVTKEPTEKEKGTRIFTATAEKDGQTYTDTKEMQIESQNTEKVGDGTIRTEINVAEDVPETAIENLTTETAKKLLNKEELEQVEKGEDIVVYLEATNIDKTVRHEDKKLVEKKQDKVVEEVRKNQNLNAQTPVASGISYIDLSLYKKVGQEKPSRLTSSGDKGLEITIEVPKELQSMNDKRIYQVIRVHEGTVDILPTVYDKEKRTLKFETDRFSTYAVSFAEPKIDVTGITLNKDKITLTKADETEQLQATITPEDASNKKVAWSTDNPGVANVDENGKVTARSNGTCTITATTEDGGKKASCAVTVEITEEPSEPSEEESEPSTEPTAPSEQPGTPETPTVPEVPSTPSTEPSAPEQPGEPAEPSVSEQPGEPAAPSEPTAAPSVPSEQPSEPGSVPSVPIIDVPSAAPSEPSAVPSVPSEQPSETPSTPSMEQPTIPSETPSTPDVPSTSPSEPALPSEEPSVPDVPSEAPGTEPGVPSEGPSVPGVPSEGPSVPDVPSEEPSVPGVPSTEPSVPSVPSEKPSVPSTEPSVPSDEPSVPSEEPSVPSTEPSTPSTAPSTPAKVTKKEQEKNRLSLNKALKVSQTKNQIDVVWGKVAGADGYDIYVQYCGSKFTSKSLNGTVKGNKTAKYTVTKVNGKKLDLKKNFKVYVKAFRKVDGKKVELGRTICAHIVGRKNVKETNVKAIRLAKTSYTLKKGKTVTLKPKSVLVDPKKKPLSDAHASEFRYASDNNAVATVSTNGKIKAVKKGTCTIYVYARNGYTKKIKVTVK